MNRCSPGNLSLVSKRVSDGHPREMCVPGGNDLPFIFSSTLVVQGKGMAVVIQTATDTAIGQIGKALATIEQKPTRLQSEVAGVVKRVSWVGFALASIVALWYGATRGDWLNGFLAGLTLAMALLPEELPVVLTVFLGIGRVAHIEGKSADSANSCNRNARRGDSPLC